MIPITLEEVHGACEVLWSAGPTAAAGLSIAGVTTDSRGDVSAKLFVGIPGPRFDGARFAAAAVEGGAVAVLAQDGPGVREALKRLAVEASVPVATCADAVSSLGAIGAAVRAKSSAGVVGITGSCGKTSTKEVLATLLGATRETCASRASFNNHIGVPLTLLEVAPDTQSLVVEIGTNHPGEIAPLAALARPDVAIVTNVGRSHLAGLGSLDGVALEKGALVASLRSGGTAILNADCPRTPELRARAAAGVRVLTFSSRGAPEADLGAGEISVGPEGTRFTLRGAALPAGAQGRGVTLPLLGEHAVANVLAALAAIVVLGADLDRSLEAVRLLRPAPHRLEASMARGVLLIDDAYNANPESVAAATQLLVKARLPGEGGLGGRRWLALGEMGELGAASSALHQEVGQMVARASIDRLVVVGPVGPGQPLAALLEAAVAGGVDAVHAASIEAGVERLTDAREGLSAGDALLVKASRAAGLEALVDQVRAGLQAGHGVTPSRPRTEVLL